MRERDTFAIPIEEMTSDKLAIRHLAFWHLLRMANKEMQQKENQYDPNAPPEVREIVQKRWRKLLEDGKLLPDPLRMRPGGGPTKQ